MNDFAKRLCRTFPGLFRKEHYMDFELEVPKSWYLLIYDLFTQLRAISVAFEIPIVVDQVKSSEAGTLRIDYTIPKIFESSTAHSIIHDLVTLAEHNSRLN